MGKFNSFLVGTRLDVEGEQALAQLWEYSAAGFRVRVNPYTYTLWYIHRSDTLTALTYSQ